MKRLWRLVRHPYVRLAYNVTYALGNLALGLIDHSNWFLTAGMYYAVLSTAKFSILQMQRKAADPQEAAQFARRFMGVLLLILSSCLASMNVLSALRDRGTAHHEIVMISIALYTFTKLTVSIVSMVRAKCVASPILRTLRDLSLADALVSVASLQRSMLVSFPGMAAENIRLFNILTGTGVWLILMLLSIHLIGGKYVDMAKSRFIKANEAIAETVTEGYKKIEKGVVEGYKAVEKSVVEGYGKLEDKFVEKYLTQENETIEQAKDRLKKGN